MLNNQQGAASSDSFLAAEHSGAARKQLGPSQGSCWQRAKDNQPSSSGCSKGWSLWSTFGMVYAEFLKGLKKDFLMWLITLVYGCHSLYASLDSYCFVLGFRCFYSSSNWWNEKWLLHGKLLPSDKDQVWQGNYLWAGWHVWTNAWYIAASTSPSQSKINVHFNVLMTNNVLLSYFV